MAFSRRPARFNSRPDSIQRETFSEARMEVLRATAAHIFINEQIPASKSSEEKKVDDAGSVKFKDEKKIASGSTKSNEKIIINHGMQSENVNEKVNFGDGMHLLATVACEFEKEAKK
ncbi:hypothetical protein Lal_00002273 [Lupinus albus]|uniref:Uncharacterized protein n=1 Tax=Lupinus albus TaxID=3870 RepID=A0A6A4PR56_LUPAL|nr:hypothetical protein Lalb_Chr11g0066391 [Lupinus albus]KAF1893750.1 hypothetical protein Lal_00002273 [Lupinus albus]